MNRCFLFLDSNILLHYKFFTEIDWCKLAAADSVELVIPCTVISTLDDKKYESADSAVRERARKVIARFLSHEDGSPIRENVTLCLLDHEPEIDFAQRGLNRESEDDRIIAEILIYREAYPDRQFAVVTGDGGMTLKCKRRNIPVLEIHEDYRLRDRLDAQTRRIRELEATVLELQNMQPKLRLAFPNGKDFIQVKTGSPKLLSNQEIRERVASKRDALHPSLALNVVEKAAVGVYLDEYQSYFEKQNRYAEYRSKMIELSLMLINNGSASGEDTDIHIFFETGRKYAVVSDSHVMVPPKEPQLPTKHKKNPMPFMQRVNDLSSSIVPLAQQIRPPNVSEPTITLTSTGQKVHYHIQRIKQGVSLPLKSVYVMFLANAEVKSLGFEYRLNSHSLPQNVTGELHVKVEN